MVATGSMAISVSSPCYILPAVKAVDRLDINADIMGDLYPTKWIDEDSYQRNVLSIWPPTTEEEADEALHCDAHDLGIVLPVQKQSDIGTITSSFSLATISSDNPTESLLSNSTAPTSCGSSVRRPSTSLSQKSSKAVPQFDMPVILTEMERKRQSGFKSGLRKMAGFRKRKILNSTASITSMRSHMTNTTTNDSISISPQDDQTKIEEKTPIQPQAQSRLSISSHVMDESLQKSSESESLAAIRSQQLEEKTRFLDFQAQLIQKLIDECNELKAQRRVEYQEQFATQEAEVRRS